jgi:CheY-like chemotaxis protein
MEANIRRVVIVSAHDEHVKRDRLSLKELRPGNITAFDNGAEALEFLDDAEIDIVLCDTRLSDMHGCKFLRILRQKPNHRSTPVVMVTLENTKEDVLDAIAAGCSGYILRPYSPETFLKHLSMAVQAQKFGEIEEEQLREARNLVDQGAFDEAVEEFEEILSMQDEAQKYYDMGCDYLVREQYGKAIISFNKALKINELFAEAYKGLADAYKGKGDEARYKENLQKAADIFARFDRMEEAKSIFIEILKIDDQAPNPYNTLGVKLRRKGDYPGAVHNYLRAIELNPEDENVHFNLSKAYFYMHEKKKSEKSLATALSINDDFPEAVRFYKELTDKEWQRRSAPKYPEDQRPRTIKDV